MTTDLLLLDVDGVLLPFDLEDGDEVPAAIAARARRLLQNRWWAWSTAWEHNAPTYLAPAVGLPAATALQFARHPGDKGVYHQYGLDLACNSKAFKLPAITRYVLEHAPDRVVIVDDDMHPSAPLEEVLGRPVLLVQPDSHEGLTDAHVDLIEAWLAMRPVGTEVC